MLELDLLLFERCLHVFYLAMLFQKLIEEHRVHRFVANSVGFPFVVTSHKIGSDLTIEGVICFELRHNRQRQIIPIVAFVTGLVGIAPYCDHGIVRKIIEPSGNRCGSSVIDDRKRSA